MAHRDLEINVQIDRLHDFSLKIGLLFQALLQLKTDENKPFCLIHEIEEVDPVFCRDEIVELLEVLFVLNLLDAGNLGFSQLFGGRWEVIWAVWLEVLETGAVLSFGEISGLGEPDVVAKVGLPQI